MSKGSASACAIYHSQLSLFGRGHYLQNCRRWHILMGEGEAHLICHPIPKSLYGRTSILAVNMLLCWQPDVVLTDSEGRGHRSQSLWDTTCTMHAHHGFSKCVDVNIFDCIAVYIMSTIFPSSFSEPTFRSCQLVSCTPVTHDTNLYTFELPSGTSMTVPIGHHVYLKMQCNGE